MLEKLVLNDLEKLESNYCRRQFNLTKIQEEAFKNLAADPSIIIKRADKGGAIIIQYRKKNIKEALKHLSDPENYKFILRILPNTL